jgi:hypothetical protein
MTLNSENKNDASQESLTGIEPSAVATTTTLSRYLYHRRWIWSSGCSQFRNNDTQKLQIQLARTLSVLTK